MLLGFQEAAQGQSSSSASAMAKMTVVAPVQIRVVNDLDFGLAGQDSGAVSVSPTSGSKAAKFVVEGEAGRAVSIVLPQNDTVYMKHQGSEDEVIGINGFISYPQSGSPIGSNGKVEIAVGATRSAIKNNQATGNYTGEFTVTVTYQ